MKLRVLSYNIHKGFSVGNRRFILEGIRTALRELSPDVVFLQEVQILEEANPNVPVTDQLEYLADGHWSHHAYGKNAIYPDGHHGNAIMSKYPITNWTNVDLSVNSLAQRGFLSCKLDIPKVSKQIFVACTHLGLVESERRVQFKHVVDLMKKHSPGNSPCFLAGDFNDWKGIGHKYFLKSINFQEAFQEMHGKPAISFPSWFPMLRLDRVYYRHAQVVNAVALKENPWKKLSDHTPLLVEFKLIFD
jgi:endonuclease/exonuclease/phosphatase family metal-dependent hydrolase